MASYPTKEIPDEVPVLSIYGSEDQVLNMKSYEESRDLWSAQIKEVVVEGGNHAQYGNYGEQKGDGEALISAEEQKRVVVENILKLFPE